MDGLRDGDQVWCGEAAGEPAAITELVVAERARLPHLTVVLGLSILDTFGPECADRFRFRSFGGFGTNRRLSDAGVLDVVPVGLSRIGGLIRAGRLPVDAVLLHVSTPDDSGRVSTGVLSGYLGAAVDRARLVVAQVNPLMPRTFGDTAIAVDRIDDLRFAERALPEVRTRADPALVAAIGEHLDGMVEDGATLQIGWGALPDAVVSCLTGKRRLTVHSGVVGDAAVRLHEAGALDEAADRPAVVAGSLAGSAALYRFADRNPAVEVWSYEHLHQSDVLARIDDLTLVNTALEVDRYGQVSAESVGGRYVGAVGGLLDFVRAARIVRNGKVVVVVPSARVVPALTGPATVPRSEVDVVVTEQGVADLRGLSLDERERALHAVT